MGISELIPLLRSERMNALFSISVFLFFPNTCLFPPQHKFTFLDQRIVWTMNIQNFRSKRIHDALSANARRAQQRCNDWLRKWRILSESSSAFFGFSLGLHHFHSLALSMMSMINLYEAAMRIKADWEPRIQ